MKLVNNDTIKALSVDEVAIVLSFLPPTDILLARVCTTWKDAARKAIVPPWEYWVMDAASYNLMRVMTTALPNIQQITICDICNRGANKYSDGEDPDEDIAAETAHYHTYNIGVISNFRKLRKLYISHALLNGSYPVLFNFPLLQSLELRKCSNLKWDLSMLSGCPQLRRLIVYMWYGNDQLTGDLRSLRALRNTLEELELSCCYEVSGSMMELADFPYIKELDLCETSITGDIRNIGRDDFPSIETKFLLPRTVVGGCSYQFQRISDVPPFIQTILPLLKREHIFNSYFYDLKWRLSTDSPDWYASQLSDWLSGAPFYISFVRAGSRLGWRWKNNGNRKFTADGCEINWLDPEPSRESKSYDIYMNELHKVEGRIWLDCFRGYYQPPTEEEYIEIYNELVSYQRLD